MGSTVHGLPKAPMTDVGDADAKEMVAGRRSFGRFFFSMLVLPLAGWLAAFPLVRSQSYERWSPSQWGPMLDFAFDTGRQDADVVIFGDSSAFVGIAPRLVNAQLGIKTIVLPGTIGSLPVTGDLALRRYLASNAAPRMLVLYFSAWNLDYLNVENIRPFEGEEMMFRHASWPEVAAFAWRHPLETLAFPLRLYSTFSPSMMRSMVKGRDRARITAEALGHADDPDPFPPLTDSCTLPARLLAKGSEGTVEALARRYATPTMPVMVYLAPVPGCSNAGALADRTFPDVGASAPVKLPAAAFLADPNFAHIEPAYVARASGLFADALGRRLGVSAAVAPAGAMQPQRAGKVSRDREVQ